MAGRRRQQALGSESSAAAMAVGWAEPGATASAPGGDGTGGYLTGKGNSRRVDCEKQKS